MNLKGNYIGELTYGEDYGKLKGDKLTFEMTLDQKENSIFGTAKDISGTGASDKQATIFGSIERSKISFVKQYDTDRRFNLFGKTTIKEYKNRKGPQIAYNGVINEIENSIEGDWVINAVFKFLWFIPIKFKNSGTWKMKKRH